MSIVTAAECATLLGIDEDDATLALVIAGAEHAVMNFLRYDPVKSSKTEFYPTNLERADTAENPTFDSINGKAIAQRVGSVLGDVLILRNRPVWNDSTLEVREQPGAYAGQLSGSFGSGTVLTKGVDYWLDCNASDQISVSGILYRIGGSWAAEPGSIKVTYNSGFADADLAGTGTRKAADIKLATMQAVAFNYKQFALNAVQGRAGLTAGPIVSEKIGPYSYRNSAASVQAYNFANSLPSSSLVLLQPHRSYAGIF